MSGVSWDQRKDGDWLASNGRWYPNNSRPKGWNRTALPPAPDHKGASALHGAKSMLSGVAQRMSDGFEVTSEDGEAKVHVPPPAAPRPATPVPRPGSSFVTPTPRSAGTADATVVDQRDHTSRLPKGAPPPPAIAAPAAPGRVRDDAPPMPAPASPPLPAPAPPASSVVAGDLGRVLGSARAKIEKRIEDAIEQVDGR